MTDGLRVDFSGVETKDFDDLPVGSYHCKLTDAEVRDNKDGPSEKNPTGQHVSFEFTVQDGPYANRKCWRNAPLGGDGVGILKSILGATGKFAEGALDGPLDFTLTELFGADVICTIGKNKQDPTRTECKRVKPYQAGAVAAAGASSLLP